MESHASCYPVFSNQEVAKRYGMHPLRPLPSRYCGESSRPSPAIRNCADYCGVRWSWREVNASDYGVFRSSCSVRCGEGTTNVHFTALCEEKVHGQGTSKASWRESSLGAYACIKAELGEPPEDRIVTSRCNGDCRPLQWVFSDWHKVSRVTNFPELVWRVSFSLAFPWLPTRQCSVHCGAGTKQRSVTCVDDMGNHWPLSECLQHLSSSKMNNLDGADNYIGTQSAECFEVDGCGGLFTWVTTPWSECRPSASYVAEMGDLCQSALKRYFDGDRQNMPGAAVFNGFQTRTTKCVMRSPSSEDIQSDASDQYCEKANVLKPIEQQICSTDFTCYRWSTVHFTQVGTS